jgi:hypothetical protein
MPIPTQNDFLRPFLTILSDGQSYTRSQMLYRLTQHFGISQQDAQAMSGRQFTLVSRVAWCDSYFAKAGFVTKKQHQSDSMKDEFRITSLGVRELNRNPDKLTVGYLQSFYRGKVQRGGGSDTTTSDAELDLLDRFESLPDEFTVFHSVKWFARETGTVGEVDFIVAHRDRGVLVVEVKGGEVYIERGTWYSRDYNGRVHELHDPCMQAERNRRALQDGLRVNPRARNLRFAIFPAVILPDSQVDAHIRPDCPRDIFIDIRGLDDLAAQFLRIFDYWRPRADESNLHMGGKAAVDALLDLLVPSRQLAPKVAEIFERERRKIDELTQHQYGALRFLKRHKRAAIIGGAGTGKTMLAMQKAAQLAEEGYRVLFLCFNASLAEWINHNLSGPNIMVATFHSLVGHAINWAKLRDIVKSKGQEFMDRAPDYLMDAVNVILAPGSGALDKLFDAIIVDEAQDFADTWWVPLPDLLRDPQNGVFYVFFDDNQRIYQQISNIPMEGEPFILDENCRNTQHIHAALAPYMHALNDTICDGPEGRPVEYIAAKDAHAERRELARVLHRLVHEDGISPDDIIVLTTRSENHSQWQPDDQIGSFTLTWDPASDIQNAIHVTTIYRFKGLESAVVILTELEKRRDDAGDALIYVGLSRARHHAIVIGELPPPQGH